MSLLLLLMCAFSIGSAAATSTPQCLNTQVLTKERHHSQTGKSSNTLEIYLNKAIPEHISNAFTDVFLTISLKDANTFRIYQALNCSGVVDEYHKDNRLFGLLKSVNSWRAHHLYPFNDTYIGIYTSEPYTVGITIWHINYIRVCLYIGGILLFVLAGTLVRNVVFYYTSGCSIGLLASVLLVAIIVYRIAPKKTIGIPLIVGGWSFSAYMLHYAWSNFASILQQYQEYVIGYFTLALLISFAICYKRGPPTDERSHDIAQWSLQLVGLVLVYLSTQSIKVSYATIAIALLHEATKSWIWRFLGTTLSVIAWIWYKIFPSRRKFITKEEYEKQAKETTAKELAKLKAFCRSPDANAWKITHSVKNPKRLARFINGTEDHISDDEYVEHELAADILDRGSEYSFDGDGEDYEHEIIIRTKPRAGISSPLDVTERSFLMPKGVSSREIFDRISASGMPDRRSSKLTQKARHSLGGAMLPIPSGNKQSFSSAPRQARETGKRVVPKTKRIASRNSQHYLRNHEFFSSDSEDQTAYEDDLVARREDFDFEQD